MKHLFESLLSTDIRMASMPARVQKVHCPTCGSHAERRYQEGIVRTECSHCDYLMTLCAETGRVIEAYAPSFSPSAYARVVTAA
ncbi:MAG: hypothetical protein WBA76_02575 [Phormidesmis sp.]